MHLVNHICNPHLKSDNTLHVIGVCSNFQRWHSRYRIAREWIGHMLAMKNVHLHIVETAFGDRHHELHHDSYLPLRTKTQIWNKENMINLGVRYLLPRDWKYMAWIDMDCFFDNKNFAQETMQQLQIFNIVQPWSECIDLGPHHEGMKMFRSFGKLHQMGVKKQKFKTEPYEYGHCGYGWACTRRFYESVEKLIDTAILGSGDYLMSWACIGNSRGTSWGMGKDFDRVLSEWEHRAVRVTHSQVGFVNGLIKHHFHGDKKSRYYQTRNQILAKHDYSPLRDIFYDENGLIQLNNKPALEHDIHHYNLSRCEDGTTI